MDNVNQNQVVGMAAEIARRKRRSTITATMLALAALHTAEAQQALQALGVRVDALAARLESLIDATPPSFALSQATIEPRAQEALLAAGEDARPIGIAILAQIIDHRCEPAASCLVDAGVRPDRLQPTDDADGRKRAALSAEMRAFLDAFTVDVTALAEDGALPPVIGREQEINDTLATLARAGKHAPVLLGDPGVGKTAIVYGIAQRIVDGRAPLLHGRRLRELNWSMFLGGTGLRGSLEERIAQLLRCVAAEGSILFIDEMHQIGAAFGGAADAGVLANLLKPALARGEIMVIGATTDEEYRRAFLRDPAMQRRWHPIYVPEPSTEDAIQIVHGVRPWLETHHDVTITDAAVRTAVRGAKRYIADKRLPDSAIDLLDSACAQVALTRAAAATTPSEADRWRAEEEQALQAGQYDVAAALRVKILEYEQTHAAAGDHAPPRPSVDEPEIVRAIARRIQAPPSVIGVDALALCRTAPDALRACLFGQEAAVQTVTDTLTIAFSGVRGRTAPVSFLCVGPPGVGKTTLARALARHFFGTEEALTVLDMGQFVEPHSTAKLIGAPPGYVGYGDPSLADKVRQRPCQTLLFDEVDKAHPAVLNVLLSILDTGRMTDALGRSVDFSQTIVVLTSNAGHEQRALGLAPRNRSDDRTGGGSAHLRRTAADLFSPELVNRIDGVVEFLPLSVQALSDIVRREVQGIVERVADLHRCTLTVDDAVVAAVVDAAVRRGGSARDVARIVEHQIGPRLAEALRGAHGAALHVGLGDDGAVCVTPRAPAERGAEPSLVVQPAYVGRRMER